VVVAVVAVVAVVVVAVVVVAALVVAVAVAVLVVGCRTLTWPSFLSGLRSCAPSNACGCKGIHVHMAVRVNETHWGAAA
jgi:hypothetical protein